MRQHTRTAAACISAARRCPICVQSPSVFFASVFMHALILSKLSKTCRLQKPDKFEIKADIPGEYTILRIDHTSRKHASDCE